MNRAKIDKIHIYYDGPQLVSGNLHEKPMIRLCVDEINDEFWSIYFKVNEKTFQSILDHEIDLHDAFVKIRIGLVYFGPMCGIGEIPVIEIISGIPKEWIPSPDLFLDDIEITL